MLFALEFWPVVGIFCHKQDRIHRIRSYLKVTDDPHRSNPKRCLMEWKIYQSQHIN